jgi:hypothetical protein
MARQLVRRIDPLQESTSSDTDSLNELAGMLATLLPEQRAIVLRRALSYEPDRSFDIGFAVGEYRAVIANVLLERRDVMLTANLSERLKVHGFQLHLIGIAVARDRSAIDEALEELIDYIADIFVEKVK